MVVFVVYSIFLKTFASPEGGWEEPYELDMFQKLGFKRITLGTRVLRTDVAVVSLLALANEACSSL